MMNLSCKIFDVLPEEAMKIRKDVFVIEQGFEEEFDSTDAMALHFLAYDGSMPIGTCRLFASKEAGTYVIGRIAVTLEYRGKGIGRYLLAQTEKKACDIGATKLELHSQCRAKDFYIKCGYTPFGTVDFEEDCPHIWMRKIINEKV